MTCRLKHSASADLGVGAGLRRALFTCGDALRRSEPVPRGTRPGFPKLPLTLCGSSGHPVSDQSLSKQVSPNHVCLTGTMGEAPQCRSPGPAGITSENIKNKSGYFFSSHGDFKVGKHPIIIYNIYLKALEEFLGF